MDYLYIEETYSIIGAAMEVHKIFGAGFLEAVYQEALAKELLLRNIPFEREKQLRIWYKGQELTKYYVADFVCYGCIIVETKALSALTNEHLSQVINYLKASKNEIGLLINFGQGSLAYKRVIYENKNKSTN
ncbi:MAG: GxxExxY protein [Prevotellaceae bacterium]|jgi:GxxExxY protein|nr:GxxExxY protein [Prevotellaceae bacterium]